MHCVTSEHVGRTCSIQHLFDSLGPKTWFTVAQEARRVAEYVFPQNTCALCDAREYMQCDVGVCIQSVPRVSEFA